MQLADSLWSVAGVTIGVCVDSGQGHSLIDFSVLWLPQCPACGDAAVGTIEQITGRARIDGVTPEGEVVWNGHVELDSESQRSELDEGGRPVFVCDRGHGWSDATVRPGGLRNPTDRIAVALEAIAADEDVPARARDIANWAVKELRSEQRSATELQARRS